MVDLRQRMPKKKLEEILALSDSFDFMAALIDLAVPPGTNFDPPPEKRHELRQMIVTLQGLHIYVGGDGIWKFLIEEGAARRFAMAKGWTRQIGATRACDYLDKTALAFPHGQIPTDDDERATVLIESKEVGKRLREIDRNYKGSFDEMAECLRNHIQQNFELFRSELDDNENRAV